MRTSARTWALAGLWLAVAMPASAAVSVTFTKPEDYSDVPRSGVERERLLEEFKDYFTKLGAKLPAGEDLKLEIIDIDLAGRIDPGRIRFNDVRILRGRADWPRMDIRYTLEANGKVLDKGEDKIADMSYLDSVTSYWSDDPLRYEKKMIDDWFKKKFLKAR
jgi:hypothetical protein